jgi:hypothetical protein
VYNAYAHKQHTQNDLLTIRLSEGCGKQDRELNLLRDQNYRAHARERLKSTTHGVRVHVHLAMHFASLCLRPSFLIWFWEGLVRTTLRGQ